MPVVYAVQNFHCESVGAIGDALRGEGLRIETVRAFDGQSIPKEMGSARGLVVMGGPMGVYERDRFRFLTAEMNLIEDALKRNLPVLGVCLGSQLLAGTLGANVRAGTVKEIGWYPVRLTESARSDPLFTGVPEEFTAYIWHGDVFDLPSGCVSLASSAITECQAFRHGDSAYGILFHMEVTEGIVRSMVEAFADELQGLQRNGSEILRELDRELPKLKTISDTVFPRWAKGVAGSGFKK
jgi:GMP synthase (glutamine-hydrolysing)